MKYENLYNIASTPKFIFSDKPINNRAKLDTGTQCNYRCDFCYYFDKLDQVTPFEIIKNRIDYLIECSITEVDLSGGESSIHKDWFKILDYCTENNLYISTLSNGYKFADIEFLKKSKEHGLKEILFSLHGSNETVHDKIVGHKGAFKRIIQAIKNCNTLQIKVRINCTVTKNNLEYIDNEFTDLINEINPEQLNYLTLNYWDNANNLNTFSYKDSTPKIKNSIDRLNIKEINVRYTPYCYMKGYEKYVCNSFQHIYDLRDWNIAVYNYSINPKMYRENIQDSMFKKAKENRIQFYKKPKECLECKFFFICDGYEKVFSELEVFPEIGEKITDVMEFRNA